MPKNENKKNETCRLADCHLTIVMITLDISRLEYIKIGVSRKLMLIKNIWPTSNHETLERSQEYLIVFSFLKDMTSDDRNDAEGK